MASRGLIYPAGTNEAARRLGRARHREEAAPRARRAEEGEPERREHAEDHDRRDARGEKEAADGYLQKLVKYVPAEVIAFFIPLTAALGRKDEGLIIAVLIAGAIGTVALLHQSSLGVPDDQRAPRMTYVLALVAFVAWAIGSSAATAGALGISQKVAGVTLGIAAFLVPAFDFWKIGGKSNR